MLERRDLQPDVAVHLPATESAWDGPGHVDIPSVSGDAAFRFRPAETARETVTRCGWTARDLATPDINSEENIAILTRLPVSVWVYSGLPKAIVKDRLLSGGQRFLHVHGGYVPQFRGSTAFYYSLLESGQIGESAIWIDQGIDTGPVIRRRWYPVDGDAEIDRVLEPVYRADLLADVLELWLETGEFPSESQTGPAETFFVIHPVLKRLALDRAGKSGAASANAVA